MLHPDMLPLSALPLDARLCLPVRPVAKPTLPNAPRMRAESIAKLINYTLQNYQINIDKLRNAY